MPDSILFWNAVAIEANRVSHSDPDKREQNGPTLSSRALAIVHIAMYDAYAGAVNDPVNFPRYFTTAPPMVPADTTVPEAVAGAAYTTLAALYPAQRDYFRGQLSYFSIPIPDNPAHPSNPAGYRFGGAVANKLLDLRRNDMDARDCGYKFSMCRGRHRVDPDNPGQGFHAPYYGAQTSGFAITERHGLKPPPFDNGTNSKYVQALRDVRTKGIRPDLTATLPGAGLFDGRRTPEETLIGIYWGYDGANRLGTPPRMYNQIVRLVAAKQENDEGKNARLFAFVNAAMGDAGILAWEQKFCHDFWRPVVGIREHDETFGPDAPYEGMSEFDAGDPGWLPLGAPSTNSPDTKNFTPPFPAYPSGHATFGAAAFHITRMFYDKEPNDKENDTLFEGLEFVSDEYNGGNRDNTGTVRPRHTRRFPGGLWQMIIENGLSRVYLGVHWIFDAFDFTPDGNELKPDLTDEEIGGVGLGLRIARDIFQWGVGKAPKQGTDTPPIKTPEPKDKDKDKDKPEPVMPTFPKQPASVNDCADTKECAGKKKESDKDKGMVQEAFPQASSERESPAQSQPQSAYPSGLSPR
jgi:membrane-associated phospholipid phosphatase